jgi:AAA15 family ATPase/GTPase
VFIKKIRIRNFKSIEDLTLNLRKINILVGANGSGKSNIIDSLILIKEVLKPSSFPPYPFITWGNYRDVVFMQDDELDVSFELEGEDGSGKTFNYSIAINGKNGFMIKEEHLKFGEYEIRRTLNEFEVNGQKSGQLEQYTSIFSIVQQIGSIRFLSSQVALPAELQNFIMSFLSAPQMNFVILRIRPEQALAPVPTNFPPLLKVNGFGLPKLLMTSMPEVFKEFMEENHMAFKLEVSAEGNIIIRLEEAVEGRGKIMLRPASVSYGTVMMMSIMAAMTTFPSSLIAIDEAENSLHLKFLERLLDILEYSGNQFILSTHSSLLIDLADVDDVVLVCRRGGSTVAERFNDPKQLTEELVRKGITLSEHIFYGSQL